MLGPPRGFSGSPGPIFPPRRAGFFPAQPTFAQPQKGGRLGFFPWPTTDEPERPSKTANFLVSPRTHWPLASRKRLLNEASRLTSFQQPRPPEPGCGSRLFRGKKFGVVWVQTPAHDRAISPPPAPTPSQQTPLATRCFSKNPRAESTATPFYTRKLGSPNLLPKNPGGGNQNRFFVFFLPFGLSQTPSGWERPIREFFPNGLENRETRNPSSWPPRTVPGKLGGLFQFSGASLPPREWKPVLQVTAPFQPQTAAPRATGANKAFPFPVFFAKQPRPRAKALPVRCGGLEAMAGAECPDWALFCPSRQPPRPNGPGKRPRPRGSVPPPP